MDGFAASFAQTLAQRKVPNPDPGMVMGYYNASDLPVYDPTKKSSSKGSP